MMIFRQLMIFLVLLNLAACTPAPSGEPDAVQPGDAGVAPLPAESASQPSGGAGVPLPPSEDFGVSCFTEYGEAILASAPSFHRYRSTDGGLTWEEITESASPGGQHCTAPNAPWELWETPDGMVRYQFDPGIAVLQSTDGGASWQTALDLSEINWQPQNTPEPGSEVVVQPGPLDAMLDYVSGNLLLAMGHAGILLRLPSGEWQWAEAGQYYHGDLSQIRADVDRLKAEGTTSRPAGTPIMPDTAFKAHENYTTSLLFTPGGESLASSGYDGGIKLFSFPAGDLQRWQQWGKGRSDSTLYGAAFSPDGRTLVTCGTNVDKTLRFWDTSNGELTRQYEGYQTGALDTTEFSAQQYLATAYGEDAGSKNQVRLFILPSGELQSTLSTQLSEITSLKFIPGSNLLMVGTSAGGVELWDVENAKNVFTLQPDQPPDGRIAAYRMVYSLGYSPALDAVLAVFGDASLKAWHASSGELAWSLRLPAPHGWYVFSATFSSDGQMLALGMDNGPLALFDSREGRAISRQWISDAGSLMELAFSPDSQWLAAGFATGELKAWKVSRLVE